MPGENAGLFITNYPVDGYLSYEALRRLRHDLICVRIMGWPDGRSAVDYTINAAVGVLAMTGPATDTRPVNHTLPAWDLLAGAYAAFTLVAAERARRQDGLGSAIRALQRNCGQCSADHAWWRRTYNHSQEAVIQTCNRLDCISGMPI
jgi:2-methylfumaryl-CoA isomerase